MRIKPNLLNTLEGITYNQINKKDNWRNVKIPIPDNLIDGETHTFSCEIKQGNTGTGYASIIIANNNLENVGNYRSENIKIDIRDFKTTFTYNKSTNNLIIVYNDIFGKTANIDAEFSNYKLEKGKESTLYNPNIDNLDPSKQAIYLAGGGIPRGVSRKLTYLVNLVDFDQLRMGVLYAS